MFSVCLPPTSKIIFQFTSHKYNSSIGPVSKILARWGTQFSNEPYHFLGMINSRLIDTTYTYTSVLYIVNLPTPNPPTSSASRWVARLFFTENNRGNPIVVIRMYDINVYAPCSVLLVWAMIANAVLYTNGSGASAAFASTETSRPKHCMYLSFKTR